MIYCYYAYYVFDANLVLTGNVCSQAPFVPRALLTLPIRSRRAPYVLDTTQSHSIPSPSHALSDSAALQSVSAIGHVLEDINDMLSGEYKIDTT